MVWRRLVRKGNTWQQLSPDERALVRQALALLALVALLLKFKGLQYTQAMLNKRLAKNPVVPRANPLTATTRAVRIAARYSRGSACLSQSLVLWYLLRRQGIESELCIGVRRTEQFQAHAWVEYEGMVLNDTPDVRIRYAAFDQLPRQ
ncbi:MAG: lasso peptide biosynthesis B2 protein [Cyanophyceae cyanobacterium]